MYKKMSFYMYLACLPEVLNNLEWILHIDGGGPEIWTQVLDPARQLLSLWAMPRPFEWIQGHLLKQALFIGDVLDDLFLWGFPGKVMRWYNSLIYTVEKGGLASVDYSATLVQSPRNMGKFMAVRWN